VRFEVLPEIPQRWIDFMNSKLPFLPAPCEMQMLSDRANAVRTSAWRKNELLNGLANTAAPDFSKIADNLKQGGFAVAFDMRAGIFGGPLSQILKCLTAIKACEELAKIGISAVPTGCVSAAKHSSFPMESINLLDRESELHSLRLQRPEGSIFSANDPIPENQAEQLISLIDDIGHGSFDTETIGAIKSAYASSAPLFSANTNLIAALMNEWNICFLKVEVDANPLPDIARALIQNRAESNYSALLNLCLAVPVIAWVMDPYEIDAYMQAAPVFDGIGLPRPAVWPQSSATILDARSRRILNRFRLNLSQLYSGEEEIAGRIENGNPHLLQERFQALASEVEEIAAEVNSLCPAGSKSAKTAETCKGKAVYQLKKLQKQCVSAAQNRDRVIRRQIHMLCNSLAPNRHSQERELGGIQVPLRYSRAGIQHLYEKLDIFALEHQLISMD